MMPEIPLLKSVLLTQDTETLEDQVVNVSKVPLGETHFTVGHTCYQVVYQLVSASCHLGK